MQNSKMTLGELLQFVEDLNKMAVNLKPTTDKLLTRKEVANFLNISLPTLHDWTKSGRIKAYRIGSRILYKSSEVIDSLTQIKVTFRLHNHGN